MSCFVLAAQSAVLWTQLRKTHTGPNLSRRCFELKRLRSDRHLHGRMMNEDRRLWPQKQAGWKFLDFRTQLESKCRKFMFNHVWNLSCQSSVFCVMWLLCWSRMCEPDIVRHLWRLHDRSTPRLTGSLDAVCASSALGVVRSSVRGVGGFPASWERVSAFMSASFRKRTSSRISVRERVSRSWALPEQRHGVEKRENTRPLSKALLAPSALTAVESSPGVKDFGDCWPTDIFARCTGPWPCVCFYVLCPREVLRLVACGSPLFDFLHFHQSRGVAVCLALSLWFFVANRSCRYNWAKEYALHAERTGTTSWTAKVKPRCARRMGLVLLFL